MKIKKYIAPNMPEAMKQIRSELGLDAVILNSREIYRGGVLGLFKKKYIEVVAAVDPLNQTPLPKKQAIGTVIENIQEVNRSNPLENGKSNDGEIVKELNQLRNMLHQLVENSSKGKESEKLVFPIPEPFQTPIHKLLKHGVEKTFINDMLPEVYETYYSRGGHITEVEAITWIRLYFINKLEEFNNSGSNHPLNKYIHLIGPTGVGKTTTIAKVAASLVQSGKRIAFMTTDTYRIGAVEQLKTYADILQVPLEVCYTKDDYLRAIERFANYDHVLIDTAGRNYRDEKYIEELTNLIEFQNGMETFLVFSLTSKEEDLEAIYDQFSHINVDRFIFTKLDETSRFGALINMPLKYKKGIAFITTGQEVPDDIQLGDSAWILNQLLGDRYYA